MGHTKETAEKLGTDFYSLRGKKKNPKKGFGSATPEQRREWGRKGGLRSRPQNAPNGNIDATT